MSESKRLDRLEKSIEKLSDQIDKGFKRTTDDISKCCSEIRQVKESMIKLENKVATMEQIIKALQTENSELQSVVAKVQQVPYNSNIIIRGIPESKKGSLKNKALSVFKLVDGNMEPQIKSVKRIGAVSNDQPRAVLVQLDSPHAKSQILRNKRKNNLNCSGVIVNGKPIGSVNYVCGVRDHFNDFVKI